MQSVTPAVGSVDGGTAVTIAGSGFTTLDRSDPAAVRFGDLPATRIVVVSDTKLIAVAPAQAGGDVLITVGTGPNASRTASFGYRRALTAVFEGITTTAVGGVQILVDVPGGGAGATSAEFTTLKITALVGDVTAKVTWVSAERVKVTVPATGKLGSFPVRLVQDGFAGPRSDATVTYLPGITSVTPSRVGTVGGDAVKIVGAGFGTVDPEDPSAVTVGGVPAASFTVVSDTVIEALTPPGEAGPAAVRVVTASGSNPESAAARVSYLGQLGLDLTGDVFVRPGGGKHLLAVSGATLGADAKAFAASGISLRLGKTKLIASWADPTHLSVTLPPQTGKSVTLTLLNGTVSADVTLPVVPVITSLSATTDTVAGGRKVTVKIAGATTATDFRFGAAGATCEGGNSVYVCVVPPAAEAGPVWVRFTSGDVTSRFTATATFRYSDLD
ncbi:IPT/TIG domain-containing protein [Actinoplanes sp. NPDC023801]|uniref:IPT/TIG domain-containing protein n=1 Tax=Actinoplanes sp. NPDC023801 TaxID=3154595 RepID=UPI0033D798C2